MSNLETGDLPVAAIDGRTAVVPLFAWPSEHVRTPTIFNRYCAARGLAAVMVPWKVAPAALPAAIATLRQLENVPGFVVTVPHKIAVASACDALEGVAEVMGVCNVVRKAADGRLVGRMYDGLGFVRGLADQGIAVAGQSALIAGAGGVATAIAYELAAAGVRRLAVLNRSRARADTLVATLAARFPALELNVNPADLRDWDLAINGTSLGLKADDALPFDVARLAAHAVVAEVVMQPDVTPLLVRAAARGLRTHKGVHMLMTQVQLLVEYTTGKHG